jgi:nicotinamidase-related amidase/type 1 glutamine amidotransferase
MNEAIMMMTMKRDICLKLGLILILGGLLVWNHAQGQAFELTTRQRMETAKGTGDWKVEEKKVQLVPQGTALVVCDMWDQHWCKGATRRVGEMAPRMNEVLKTARQQGALIIHCPSSTLDFYKNTPQRELARQAPSLETPIPLQSWCHLDPDTEAPLPIDDSDGGCDDWPQCRNYQAWTRQIDTLDIEAGDAVTDSSEAYFLMRQRGITNVVVMGVHLNMCVLGRPFSIRQMVNQGQNVYLVRDLTDTMYNSRKSPKVPHCVGTELMVEHVEKYWCSTVSSTDFVGGKPFRFKEDVRPKVVFMIGEDEYKTWETLPEFAAKDLAWRGFETKIIHQDQKDKNLFPGLVESLQEADLLFLSVRRRSPAVEQLQAVRDYLEAGKPLVAIRTSSHAFAKRGRENDEIRKNPELDVWVEFDPEVLGGHYTGHHGNGPKTTITKAVQAGGHPILDGVDTSAWLGHGSLYQASPLAKAAEPLLWGTIPGKDPEPVAWTHVYGPEKARIFYTSLGHPDDFGEASFRTLLVNAMQWALKKPEPAEELPAQESKTAMEKMEARSGRPGL